MNASKLPPRHNALWYLQKGRLRLVITRKCMIWTIFNFLFYVLRTGKYVANENQPIASCNTHDGPTRNSQTHRLATRRLTNSQLADSQTRRLADSQTRRLANSQLADSQTRNSQTRNSQYSRPRSKAVNHSKQDILCGLCPHLAFLLFPDLKQI